jgi:hypothetical protein
VSDAAILVDTDLPGTEKKILKALKLIGSNRGQTTVSENLLWVDFRISIYSNIRKTPNSASGRQPPLTPQN